MGLSNNSYYFLLLNGFTIYFVLVNKTEESLSILDIARTFKALNLKPKRTIEFVLFMGEEEGLLGSKAMIERSKKNNSIETTHSL